MSENVWKRHTFHADAFFPGKGSQRESDYIRLSNARTLGGHLEEVSIRFA